MKIKNKNLQSLAIITFSMAIAIIITGLLTGCEADSATQRIEITPSSAVLKYGESVTLTARNGYEYDWSLTTPGIGVLSSYRGNQVVYKSIIDPASPQVQVVKVTSTFSDSYYGGGSSTGSTPVTHTAEAYITHIPSTNTAY